MDFPTHQHEARQNTVVLVALLALGVLAIVAVVSALFTVLLAATAPEVQSIGVLTVVAPLTAFGVVGTSVVRSSQVRGGGGAYVATSMGGRRIDAVTRDPGERRLVNVVEEIAIASGSPVPELFVLDDEPGINAFAAGWTADQAAIGVTRGALVHLDRHELQGVIAHEFSHITNGDTRIKTRIIGWVFGIAALTVLGRILLHQLWWAPRRRDRQDRTGLFLVAAGLGLLVVGAVGALFARLVQAAVSRQREYLADASAVQYTRDPSGIGGALDEDRRAGRWEPDPRGPRYRGRPPVLHLGVRRRPGHPPAAHRPDPPARPELGRSLRRLRSGDGIRGLGSEPESGGRRRIPVTEPGSGPPPRTPDPAPTALDGPTTRTPPTATAPTPASGAVVRIQPTPARPI